MQAFSVFAGAEIYKRKKKNDFRCNSSGRPEEQWKFPAAMQAQ